MTESRPWRRWRVAVLLALGVLVLPAAVRREGAVVASGLSGFVLVFLGAFWLVPVAFGPVRLEAGRLTVRTVRGPRSVDLSTLRAVGGYQMRYRGQESDLLRLRDEAGGDVALLAPPGFPVQPGPRGAALLVAHRAVRRAVQAQEVHDVSESAKRVLDLPAEPDGSETALALALWAAFVACALGAMVLPMALWSLLVPL